MSATPVGPAETPQPRYLSCTLCGRLADQEYAIQHVQGDADDTVLPAAASRLVLARAVSANLQLMRCPECQTYYLQRSSYEFLIGFGGSYDEQYLSRLSDALGADYLAGRRSEPLRGTD